MHVTETIAADLTSVDACHHGHLDEGEYIDMGEDIQEDITRSSKSSLASGSMKLEGGCAFLPSKITRKRNSDASELDAVLPPAKPGIGDSMVPEKELLCPGMCREQNHPPRTQSPGDQYQQTLLQNAFQHEIQASWLPAG